MPLTLTEQMDIIEKRVGPPNVDVELLDLVSAQGYFESTNYIDNPKTVDPVTQQLAASYVQKMDRLTYKIFQGSVAAMVSIMTILVTKGAANTDIATIQALDQSGWENFVSSFCYAGMEYAAGITNAEKIEYDAIV